MASLVVLRAPFLRFGYFIRNPRTPKREKGTTGLPSIQNLPQASPDLLRGRVHVDLLGGSSGAFRGVGCCGRM